MVRTRNERDVELLNKWNEIQKFIRNNFRITKSFKLARHNNVWLMICEDGTVYFTGEISYFKVDSRNIVQVAWAFFGILDTVVEKWSIVETRLKELQVDRTS